MHPMAALAMHRAGYIYCDGPAIFGVTFCPLNAGGQARKSTADDWQCEVRWRAERPTRVEATNQAGPASAPASRRRCSLGRSQPVNFSRRRFEEGCNRLDDRKGLELRKC
jgi:hypothetical protein